MTAPQPRRGDEVIGFVGVGAIGRPMADCIVATGREVVVYDLSAGARDHFAGRARVAASGREVADRCDVVLACLPDESATVAAFAELRTGSRMRIFLQTGTSGPGLFAALASAAGPVTLVDSPVTGGVPRARAGDLTAIVAGPAAAVSEVEDVLHCFASKIVRVSERSGDAQRMKLVNNYLSAANLALACEALVLAQGAGLDPQVMLEVVNSGSGQNSATLTKLPDYVLPRRFDRGGHLYLMLKDLNEAAKLASDAGVPIPLGDEVRAAFERAVAAGAPGDDVTTVVRHMERAAGLVLD